MNQFSLLSKLTCDIEIATYDGSIEILKKDNMKSVYESFLTAIQNIINLFAKKIFTNEIYNMMLTEVLIETFGYFSLKSDFKEAILSKIESDKTASDKLEVLSLLDCLKYIMLICVQTNEDLDKAQGGSVQNKFQALSSLVFMILNLVRSEDYDTMAPSLTFSFKDQLKDKEVSYYELK